MSVRSQRSFTNSMAIYVIYLASWHNVIPEPSLVAEVTHVCLAFIDDIRGKFAKGTKFLWALGGWGDTEGFSIAAKSTESRKLFARNVKSLIDATNTDGIDLDWEYPGGNGDDYKQPGTTNSDKAWEIDTYPELISELRLSFGPGKILSAAIPGLSRDMTAFGAANIAKIVPHMDFFNIMTYDLMNRRDKVTKHHAGIKASLEVVNTYLANGIPPHKAVLGFGFYAKWFKIVPIKAHDGPIRSSIGLPTVKMENPTTGKDLGTSGAFVWSEAPSTSVATSFDRAMALGSYDDYHEGYCFLDDKEDIFWSWETPEAIVKKYNTIMGQKSLGGVFAWELGGDSRDWSHLRALNSAVKAATSAERKQRNDSEF